MPSPAPTSVQVAPSNTKLLQFQREVESMDPAIRLVLIAKYSACRHKVSSACGSSPSTSSARLNGPCPWLQRGEIPCACEGFTRNQSQPITRTAACTRCGHQVAG
jgi:hypothetical protein